MWYTNYKKRVMIKSYAINNKDTYDSNVEKDVFWFFNYTNS